MATSAPADLAGDIAKARQLATTAQRMREQATTAQDFAKNQLGQIDEALKAEGINPEHVEQEVAALEVQLAETTAQITAQLQEEITALERVMALARQAQLVR